MNQAQVEYAFNTFFQLHPEVLEHIFKNLDYEQLNKPKMTQLPEIAPKGCDIIVIYGGIR